MFDDAYARGWQVINHANGDAAIERLIRAANAATEKHGPADRRTIGVHSQTTRTDQLDAYIELVILDANPIEVPREALFDLEVVETIKEGETIYRRDE